MASNTAVSAILIASWNSRNDRDPSPLASAALIASCQALICKRRWNLVKTLAPSFIAHLLIIRNQLTFDMPYLLPRYFSDNFSSCNNSPVWLAVQIFIAIWHWPDQILFHPCPDRPVWIFSSCPSRLWADPWQVGIWSSPLPSQHPSSPGLQSQARKKWVKHFTINSWRYRTLSPLDLYSLSSSLTSSLYNHE